MLTCRQAAIRYNLGFSTLAKWRITGQGPNFIRIGRKVLYDPRDIEQWLDGRRVVPEPVRRRRGRPTKAEQIAARPSAAFA